MSVQLPNLWTAASVIVGFQFTAFMWRIAREISMAERGQWTWLPISDALCLISLVITVTSVFLLPILGLADLALTNRLFGLGVLLFMGYPFALVGHYRLYLPTKKDLPARYFPLQEAVASVGVILVALAYVYLALFSGR